MDGIMSGIANQNPKDGRTLLHARRRPIASRLLQELEAQSLQKEVLLTAGRRMEMAFSLSTDLRKLLRASMRSRGLPETGIEHWYNRRRR